jgi:predicted transcriptional regulator
VPRVHYANLNGADGLRLTRAAFSALIKFSELFDSFSQLVDEVDMQWVELEQDEERDIKMKDIIKAFPNFDGINKRWEHASKMRSWINEFKNTLRQTIEDQVNKESADKSETERSEIIEQRYTKELNEMFTKVVQKAEFLLKLNVPEGFLAKD